MEKSQARLGTVLIVEDQREVWLQLKRELHQSGLFSSLVIADTLERAESQFATRGPFSGILMDACLSGTEKPDTLELIMDIRRTFDGPIVAMSRDSRFRQLQIKCGCDLEAEVKEEAAKVLIQYLLSKVPPAV